MSAHLGFAGRFVSFTKYKADDNGEPIMATAERVAGDIENLITIGGLNLLGSTAGDNLAYCRIGDGVTPPADGDLALASHVGATAMSGDGGAVGVSGDGTYIYRRVSRRFLAGTVAGLNLAEVGMARTGTGGQIFSRALIKDGGGVATTITLAADEILDVLYELRMYLPAQDITVAATIDGVPSTVTMRHSKHTTQLSNWASALGLRIVNASATAGWNYSTGVENLPPATGWGSMPTSSSGDPSWVDGTLAPYVADSFTTKYTYVAAITKCNYATGIGALVLGAGAGGASAAACAFGPWAWGFSPKLNKNPARTATITVSVTWGRHTP